MEFSSQRLNLRMREQNIAIPGLAEDLEDCASCN